MLAPGQGGLLAYDEVGQAIQYGDLDADQHPLHDVVLLRRLNRVELVATAISQPRESVRRAHEGGSCWEDYPRIPSHGLGRIDAARPVLTLKNRP